MESIRIDINVSFFIKLLEADFLKTYFNEAVIGNSNILACLDKRGELIRFFWPHIDYPQHIDIFKIGVSLLETGQTLKWLYDEDWEHKQSYIKDTNIVENIYKNSKLEIQLESTDFVLYDGDVLIRSMEIKNSGTSDREIDLIVFASFISNQIDIRSSLFDFNNDCMVYYRHGYYISVAGSKVVSGFQIGNNPYGAAINSQIHGIDEIGMTGEAVQSWKLGKFSPGETKNITIYISCGHSLKESLELTSEIKKEDIYLLIDENKKHWHQYLSKGKKAITDNDSLNELYNRSLLVFKLMSDNSGGLLAAPELDESFTRCGRYAYCWGRDAGFITSALDRAGYPELVDKFYQWAKNTQAENGSWYQRYYVDGNLAPSWGLQIDETGTLIWGMLQHYKTTENKEFLRNMWTSVKKAANFLIHFIDTENNLPKATYDLWEERVGQHVYSVAAVCAGLYSAVEINFILEQEEQEVVKWKDTADRIKDLIENTMWDNFQSRFYRGLNTKIEEWGFEGHGGKKEKTANIKGYTRWVSALDIMIDISLIGVVIPFKLFDCNHKKVTATVSAIENHLKSPIVGGIRRYETDNYMGGNPWIITTLWLALYYIKTGNRNKAKEYLLWTTKHTTSMGMLPEQVDKNTGEPIWVFPLTWSHAMYVLVYMELFE
jgi:oligosaccharide amylase